IRVEKSDSGGRVRDGSLVTRFLFAGFSSRAGRRDGGPFLADTCRLASAICRSIAALPCWRGRKIRFAGELTERCTAPKLEKLFACRGSSLVERRPEKAGVASSILAPGTIRSRHFLPTKCAFNRSNLTGARCNANK